MIDFITSHIKFIIVLTIVILILGFAPEVTVLPFGMDSVLSTSVGVIKSVLAEVDFLRVPWYLFLAMLGVDFAFFAWKWVNYFIDLYKGK